MTSKNTNKTDSSFGLAAAWQQLGAGGRRDTTIQARLRNANFTRHSLQIIYRRSDLFGLAAYFVTDDLSNINREMKTQLFFII